MVRYEIAWQKAVDAWLDIATPRPDPAGAQVTAEVQRLRDVARDRLRAEARQTYLVRLQVLKLMSTLLECLKQCAMNEAAIETIWRANRASKS